MRAEIYLILAAIFWGINFHFAQLLMSQSSYIEAASWRYIFGVITLIIIGWRELRTIKLEQVSVKGILLVGIVGLFFFNVFFFKGLSLTDAINASLIVNLNPILTILFASVMIGLRITYNHVIGALLSLSGVAYLLFKGDISNVQSMQFNSGDVLIFVCAILFALHNVWVKMYKGELSNLNFTTLTNICCLLGFIFLLPIQGESISVSHSSEYWIWCLCIGSLGTAVAYYSYNKGVSMIGPDRASMFLNLVPLTTALSGIALGQSLNTYHIISGLIILTGVTIAQRAKPVA